MTQILATEKHICLLEKFYGCFVLHFLDSEFWKHVYYIPNREANVIFPKKETLTTIEGEMA
jgi:hypothetical protein